MFCAWYYIEITTMRVTVSVHSSGNFSIRTTDFHKMDDGSSYHESAQRDTAGARCQTMSTEGTLLCIAQVTQFKSKFSDVFQH